MTARASCLATATALALVVLLELALGDTTRGGGCGTTRACAAAAAREARAAARTRSSGVSTRRATTIPVTSFGSFGRALGSAFFAGSGRGEPGGDDVFQRIEKSHVYYLVQSPPLKNNAWSCGDILVGSVISAPVAETMGGMSIVV